MRRQKKKANGSATNEVFPYLVAAVTAPDSVGVVGLAAAAEGPGAALPRLRSKSLASEERTQGRREAELQYHRAAWSSKPFVVAVVDRVDCVWKRSGGGSSQSANEINPNQRTHTPRGAQVNAIPSLVCQRRALPLYTTSHHITSHRSRDGDDALQCALLKNKPFCCGQVGDARR